MAYVAYWSYDHTTDGLQPDGSYRYPGFDFSTAWSTAPGNTSTTQATYGDLRNEAFGGAVADEMVFQHLLPIQGYTNGALTFDADEDLASVLRLRHNFIFEGLINRGPDASPEDRASVNFSADALITGTNSYAAFYSLNLNTEHDLNVRLDGLHFSKSIITVGALNVLNTGTPRFTMQLSTLNGDINFATNMLIDVNDSIINGDISIGQRAYINDTTVSGTVSLRSDALDPYDPYENNHIFISLWGTNILSPDIAIEGNTKDNAIEIVEGAVTGDVYMGAGADVLRLDRTPLSGNIGMGHGDDYLYVDLATVHASLKMAAGNDVVSITRSEFIGDIHMGRGDDELSLHATSTDTIVVRLNAGNDTLKNYGTNIRAFGGDGDDRLYIDGGRNWVAGDDGADTFIIASTTNGVDREHLAIISDFNHAEGDKIDVSRAGSQFAGNAFTGTAGDVIQVGRQLRIDIDGDAQTDMIVIVRGDALVTDDFIF